MLEPSKNGKSNGVNGNSTVRFGAFEADLHSGEVRKSGSRIKLQEQPFKVLQILLEHPGALVTRDELQSRIWPAENFGDFDHAVNVAIGKLRTALGDTADNPCFIETVPRRGYRFVAKLEDPPVEAPPPEVPAISAPPSPARQGKSRALPALLAVVVAALLVGLGVLLGHRTVRPQSPEFQRLTVRRGTVYNARFAPDGHNVIYAASWDGAPIEIFSTDLNLTSSRDMELPATHMLAVSPSGEMAVLESVDPSFMFTVQGTLGKVPLTGGSPRKITEHVEGADWSPDGKTLAIVHVTGAKRRLEYPLGHVLYETAGWISHARISPKGDAIAFLDHPSQDDDQGVVSLVDLSGRKRVLSTGWESEEGLAWSPDGSEVWFSATRAGLERRIYAVDLAGRQRLAYQALGGVSLQDIAPDGRVLLTRDEDRAGMIGAGPEATKEQDLSWEDWSLPVDLSPDGKTLLFDEQGEQGGPTYTVAMRSTSGSPPIPLGEGMAGDLSPDGKWAATDVSYSQILLLPTGAGTVKRIDKGGIDRYGHVIHWMPDSEQIIFSGNLTGRGVRCFIQNIDGGKPRPLTPEGVGMCEVSPDGQLLIGHDLVSEESRFYPMDGGSPRAIPGLAQNEIFEWSSDPHILYVYQGKQQPVRVYRLNVVSGERQFFKEFHPGPGDSTGLYHMSHILFSADGRAYVYSYIRMLSELYVVKGLK
jgi:DNA-binding winged helix-turn-helix (wHTH) protein/Tol biopolymer transport system component